MQVFLSSRRYDCAGFMSTLCTEEAPWMARSSVLSPPEVSVSTTSESFTRSTSSSGRGSSQLMLYRKVGGNIGGRSTLVSESMSAAVSPLRPSHT